MNLLDTISASNQCHSTFYPNQQLAIRNSLYTQIVEFVVGKMPLNTPFQLEFSERTNSFPANDGSLIETTVEAKLFVSSETKNNISSCIDIEYSVLGAK